MRSLLAHIIGNLIGNLFGFIVIIIGLSLISSLIRENIEFFKTIATLLVSAFLISLLITKLKQIKLKNEESRKKRIRQEEELREERIRQEEAFLRKEKRRKEKDLWEKQIRKEEQRKKELQKEQFWKEQLRVEAIEKYYEWEKVINELKKKLEPIQIKHFKNIEFIKRNNLLTTIKKRRKKLGLQDKEETKTNIFKRIKLGKKEKFNIYMNGVISCSNNEYLVNGHVSKPNIENYDVKRYRDEYIQYESISDGTIIDFKYFLYEKIDSIHF